MAGEGREDSGGRGDKRAGVVFLRAGVNGGIGGVNESHTIRRREWIVSISSRIHLCVWITRRIDVWSRGIVDACVKLHEVEGKLHWVAWGGHKGGKLQIVVVGIRTYKRRKKREKIKIKINSRSRIWYLPVVEVVVPVVLVVVVVAGKVVDVEVGPVVLVVSAKSLQKLVFVQQG
jgi:hypothetical protein